MTAVHTGLQKQSQEWYMSKFMATTTILENIMDYPHKEKSPYEKFYGKIMDYEKHLMTLV